MKCSVSTFANLKLEPSMKFQTIGTVVLFPDLNLVLCMVVALLRCWS